MVALVGLRTAVVVVAVELDDQTRSGPVGVDLQAGNTITLVRGAGRPAWRQSSRKRSSNSERVGGALL